MRELERQLDVEQEKLAGLVRTLASDTTQSKQQEETVSEDWLQSLKERRKVGGALGGAELGRYWLWR